MQFHRLEYVLLGIEPHAIHPSVAIGKMPYEAFLSAFANLFETDELSTYLHEWHVGCQFRGVVEAASVYVLVGEIVQQVTPGLQTQFLLQEFGSLGADTRQVRKFGVKDGSTH